MTMQSTPIHDIEALYERGQYHAFLPKPTFDWDDWNADFDRRIEALRLTDARCREATAKVLQASAELRAAIDALAVKP